MDMERTLATLERRIARLEQGQVAVPLRGNSGGGKTPATEWVKVLPPIPTRPRGYKIVFWMSSATETGGTGDDQAWEAYTGQTAYTPCQFGSSLSGVPV